MWLLDDFSRIAKDARILTGFSCDFVMPGSNNPLFVGIFDIKTSTFIFKITNRLLINLVA